MKDSKVERGRQALQDALEHRSGFSRDIATLAMDALRCKSAPMIEKEFAAIATLKLPHRPDRVTRKETTAKKNPILTVLRQVARDMILAQRKLNRVT